MRARQPSPNFRRGYLPLGLSRFVDLLAPLAVEGRV